MASRLTFRDRVRRWFGVEDLPSNTQIQALRADLLIELDWLKNHGAKFEQIQGIAVANEHMREEILGALQKLTLALNAGHHFEQPNFMPATLDWDTVQALALHDLENPPKEN